MDLLEYKMILKLLILIISERSLTCRLVIIDKKQIHFPRISKTAFKNNQYAQVPINYSLGYLMHGHAVWPALWHQATKKVWPK